MLRQHPPASVLASQGHRGQYAKQRAVLAGQPPEAAPQGRARRLQEAAAHGVDGDVEEEDIRQGKELLFKVP